MLSVTPAAPMSDAHNYVRRIGTRAAVRQEASNMAGSEAATTAAEAAPPATLTFTTVIPNKTTTTPTAATGDTTPTANSTPTSDSSPDITPNADPPNDDSLDAETTDDFPIVELKVEPKLEPMDTSPPPEPTVTTNVLPVTLQTTTSTPMITTIQLKENLLLQPLGPSPFTGRKRKANFTNEETEMLVRDVVTHFSALYGSEALRTESTRRNQRRSELWTMIQKNVNELGYTPRSIDDLKHKWRDLRLEVKRKITQRKNGGKVSPSPGVPPIIDTKLTPMEDLVASTIGHHCTLEGEQEGMYMEPGVPRQSIFFTCRGPGGTLGEIGSDMVGSGGSPRATPEISVLPPLVGTSPATQLSFVRVTEDKDNGERNKDVPPKIQIKTFPDNWPTLKEVCTLVTTQKLIPTQNLIPAQPTIIAAPAEIRTVKQEVLPVLPLQPVLVPSRCESQNSIASSTEGSIGNPTGQPKSIAGGSNGGSSNGTLIVTVIKTDGETVKKLKVENCEPVKKQLKVENCEAESLDGEEKASPPAEENDQGNWQENQEEWERPSQSPHSEMAPEDSMPSSSSQDGDPSSAGELPTTNGDCSFDPDDRRHRNMNRLLELEEQWDRLYHRELGMWEEERAQQQQQRNQDRELQQQLLGVLTDIRDELRQLRQERAEARQNQALANNADCSAPPTNASPPPAAETPTKPSTESPPETPAKSSPPVTAKRRGRPPRLVRTTPEPAARPTRPASESKS